MKYQHDMIAAADLDASSLIKDELYNKKDVVFFFSSREPYYLLSNMAMTPIEFKNVNYNSSEALFQSCKYGTGVMCTPVEGKGDRTTPNVRTYNRSAQSNGS